MLKQKTYCINCDKECAYIIKKEKRNVTVKDLSFEVEVNVAFCECCGEQVFPDKVAKENDLIVFDEYRRLKGLLTSQEIKKIREKRGMTQIELARFINAGDKNIARYETGTIQDAVFDNLLRMVDDDMCYNAMCEMKKRKIINKRLSF